jgi:hypothetical protein
VTSTSGLTRRSRSTAHSALAWPSVSSTDSNCRLCWTRRKRRRRWPSVGRRRSGPDIQARSRPARRSRRQRRALPPEVPVPPG